MNLGFLFSKVEIILPSKGCLENLMRTYMCVTFGIAPGMNHKDGVFTNSWDTYYLCLSPQDH